MRAWRVIVLFLLLAAGAAAVWFATSRRSEHTQAGPAENPEVAYDYEAHNAVLRQMGPDGRMAFQIEAREITQLPASGRITAQGVTMYHDPPGTEIGGPNRWTVTANSGELPAEGGVITLAGKVRAHGIPVGGHTEMTVATEHLRYDPATQELSSDDEVLVTWGASTTRARGLRANIKTSDVELGSEINATVVPP